MYYYLFSYGGYDGHTEYSLMHTKKYSDEKFSEIIDTACKEVAEKMMPDQIEKKKSMARYLKGNLIKMKKAGHDRESLEWHKKWAEQECKERDLTIQTAALDIVEHLEQKYGFKQIKHTAEQSFDEDFAIGKIPAVPFLK